MEITMETLGKLDIFMDISMAIFNNYVENIVENYQRVLGKSLSSMIHVPLPAMFDDTKEGKHLSKSQTERPKDST